MLTKVSVIFSLCESDRKPIGFVIFYSPECEGAFFELSEGESVVKTTDNL